MARRSTSPWVYVGCGCLGAVVLAIGACVSVGLFGVQFARNLEQELKDPVLRQEKAREILGAEKLPDGFHAQVHVSIPLFMDMVVLSDGQPIELEDDGNTELEPENLGDQAFIYLAMRDIGDVRDDFERMLDGGDTRDLENVDVGLDFRSEEVLGRGEFELPPQRVRYATHRGAFRDGRESNEGVYSVLLVDCPSTSRVRAAFHWRRVDAGDLPAEDLPAEDLPAEADPGELDPAAHDPAAHEADLKRLMGHFQLCAP